MKALFIIAKEGYQDHEYGAPKKILEENGVEVVTASKEVGKCKGSFGDEIEASVSISDVNVSDYDAIVFIGGPGAREYQHDGEAHLTAQEAVNRGKVLGAICIAPTILAFGGVLEGKKATVWNEDGKQQEVLESNGAEYVKEDVIVDGTLSDSNFNSALINFPNIPNVENESNSP